jgi:hypothetical protein
MHTSPKEYCLDQGDKRFGCDPLDPTMEYRSDKKHYPNRNDLERFSR